MSKRVQTDLALAFATLIWGATFVVVKEALNDASVFAFIAVRFTFAAVLMAAINYRAVARITRGDLRAGFLIGVFMFSGYAAQTVGLQFTTPSKAGFITGFSVVLVPVLLAVFWRRGANFWIWLGAATALAGLYFLSVPAAGFSGLNLGDVLVFLCAVLFAFHIIFVARYTGRHSVAALSFLQIATTAVLAIVFLPVLHFTGGEAARFQVTSGLIGAILLTAVGATALAFSIQVWAQQYTAPTHTALIFSLEPVFAAVTSYLVLDERLGARGLAGGALILAGILLAELRGPAPASPDSPAALADSSSER